MAFRILLDTEILLDFTLKRDGYAISRKLMEWAVKGRVQVFVTAAMLQELGIWLKRAYGAVRAKELLLALLSEVQVIETEHTVVVSALHSTMGSIETALPYHAALHHKLDYYISRDKEMKAEATAVLPVCTPEEFVEYNGEKNQ